MEKNIQWNHYSDHLVDILRDECGEVNLFTACYAKRWPTTFLLFLIPMDYHKKKDTNKISGENAAKGSFGGGRLAFALAAPGVESF